MKRDLDGFVCAKPQPHIHGQSLKAKKKMISPQKKFYSIHVKHSMAGQCAFIHLPFYLSLIHLLSCMFMLCHIFRWYICVSMHQMVTAIIIQQHKKNVIHQMCKPRVRDKRQRQMSGNDFESEKKKHTLQNDCGEIEKSELWAWNDWVLSLVASTIAIGIIIATDERNRRTNDEEGRERKHWKNRWK